MFAGFVTLPKQINVTVEEVKGLLEKLFKLADIAQKEINAIIINSGEMRRHDGTTSRTLH